MCWTMTTTGRIASYRAGPHPSEAGSPRSCARPRNVSGRLGSDVLRWRHPTGCAADASVSAGFHAERLSSGARRLSPSTSCEMRRRSASRRRTQRGEQNGRALPSFVSLVDISHARKRPLSRAFLHKRSGSHRAFDCAGTPAIVGAVRDAARAAEHDRDQATSQAREAAERASAAGREAARAAKDAERSRQARPRSRPQRRAARRGRRPARSQSAHGRTARRSSASSSTSVPADRRARASTRPSADSAARRAATRIVSSCSRRSPSVASRPTRQTCSPIATASWSSSRRRETPPYSSACSAPSSAQAQSSARAILVLAEPDTYELVEESRVWLETVADDRPAVVRTRRRSASA